MDDALDALGAGNHIDLAILSHGHIDHVGGFRKLVQDFHYEVDRVLASPNAKWSTVTNQSVLDALTVGGGAELTWANKGDSLSLGGATVSVLSPPQGTFTTVSNIENSSLVYTLSVNGRRLLFTGDIKGQATAELAADWGDSSSAATTERIYCTATNGTVRATISTSGAISWQSAKQSAPWWSRAGGQTGLCAGR